MDTISRLDQSTPDAGRARPKALIILAHPERHSFNGAMADAAVETLRGQGYDVVFSDLYRMGFDPVSDRRNFATVKNADYFKQQAEEDHATETGGFAPDVEAEIANSACSVGEHLSHVDEAHTCHIRRLLLIGIILGSLP